MNLPSQSHWTDPLVGLFLRFAAGGAVPARWFMNRIPAPKERHAKTGRLNIEIVSHCWNYSHFLAYQLSSLVKFPPQRVNITMTVFYSDEDVKTRELLDFFGQIERPTIRWNWQSLPKSQLFRRAIGRNMAAQQTTADWIWFTDCDLLFRDNCLDELSHRLQGRKDTLVYPQYEKVTSLLPESDPMLKNGATGQIVDINPQHFSLLKKSRATGPLQITHGDVARACGYCADLSLYQKPSDVWCKAYEDRAFRWLLRTQGVPIDLPGVYRIRHVSKGRYTGSQVNTSLRSRLRRLTSR